MKLLLVTLVAFISAASAQKGNIPDCTNSGTYVITNDHELIGCKGVAGGRLIDIWWNIQLTTPRLINFLAFDMQSNYHRVYIYMNNTQLYAFVGKTNPGLFNWSSGYLQIRLVCDSSPVAPGTNFILEMMPQPRIYNLVSNQPFSLTETQPGGFVYFTFPDTQFGKVVVATVDVAAYQGLQPPALFMSGQHLPALEYSDWSNITQQDRGHWISAIRVDNPITSKYYIGVFLYGSSTKLTVKYQWTYNFNSLSNGVKVSRSATGTENWQLYVPPGTPKLTIQISRQAPGGYVIAYITQGTLPVKSNAQWTMDTSAQSYISLSINNPNPYDSKAANPGWINIGVTLGQTVTSAGYILQADW